MSFGPDRGSAVGFCDPVGELRSAVRVLVDQDPAEMVAEELKTDLLRFARSRDQEDAAFASWVRAAVRRGVGVEDG